MLKRISSLQFPLWLALTLPVILTIVFIWFPFGFEAIALIEEWSVLQAYDTHGVFFLITPNTPFQIHALRPLIFFPWALAYAINPNSFYGWHVLLILALFVKGTCSSYLMWKATRSLKLAAIMGVLIVLYPADTMQLAFRGLHINWAIALILLSSSFFIIAFEQKRSLLSYALALVSSALLFSACAMYEATLLLTPLPLLILYVRDGFRGMLTQVTARKALTSLWLLGAIAYIAYAIYMSTLLTSNYQESLSSGRSLTVLIDDFLKLFSVGIVRGLVAGWYDALLITFTEFRTYLYLSIATLIISCSFLLSSKQNGVQSDNTLLLSYRLAISGLLLLIFGYSPFLLSHAHLYISQRTFLCASFGAAMFWIAILVITAKASALLSRIVTMFLVFIGLGTQVYQFHHYIGISNAQKVLFKKAAEGFEGNIGDKTLLILDGTSLIGHTWMLLPGGGIEPAISYILDQKINSVQACRLPSHEWQYPDPLQRKGTCRETKNEWIFEPPSRVTGPGYTHTDRQALHVAKDQIVTISIIPDEYSIKTLQNRSDRATKRYYGILARKPWLFNFNLFNDSIVDDQYKWDFGRWWSMELPIRGSGWRDAEWEVNSFHHKASSWKTLDRSTLYFDFMPAKNQHYSLRGKFDKFANASVLEGVKIQINGHDIDYHCISTGEFEAEIPLSILISGVNIIAFDATSDPNYFGLSVALDWFEITKS